MAVAFPGKYGIFPARAGMSPGRPRLSTRFVDFPRTRGDEPSHWRAHTDYTRFSPHARG